MNEFDAFNVYLAFKLHFTTDRYDITKTRGAVKTKDETFYCEFHTLCRLCEVSASNIHALAFFCSTNGISSTSCNEVLESQIQQKIAIYFNV